MINKKSIGSYGESLASEYLMKSGYRILCENYKSRFGEIDIIAMKNSIIFFTEVKTRYNHNFGFPCESINSSKKRHIIRTSQLFILEKKFYNYNLQFDVIEVTLNYNDDTYSINHIKSAF